MTSVTRFLFGTTAAEYMNAKQQGKNLSIATELPLNGTLGRSITRASAAFGFVQMAFAIDSAFANDNRVDVSTVGYVTEASMGLKNRVVYLGSVTDNDGHVSHRYTTQHILTYDTWKNCEREIKNLNEEGTYAKEFGQADFPTSRYGLTGTDELDLFYKNKDVLSMETGWIHGESCDPTLAYYLHCRHGHQHSTTKNHIAAAFPVWRVDHLVI